MPKKMSETQWIAERDVIPGLLLANRERRDAAEAEQRAARTELDALIDRAYRVGFGVTEIAKACRFSRETIHKHVRESGAKAARDQRYAAAERARESRA